MPIRPERMSRYPGGSIRSPEWKAIVAAVGERSGWKCEACGVPHKAWIWRGRGIHEGLYRIETSEVFDEDSGEPRGTIGYAMFRSPPAVEIILTVAHFDHDETNNNLANLRHWCQLHHNRHDAPHRAAGIAARRRQGSAGGDLFEGGR